MPQGKQPLLLESGEGSPSRPTQKPSTNQRKLNNKEDDQRAPNPDVYYVEDPDLDYYNPSHQSEEENTPTALVISHKHVRVKDYLPKPAANTLPTAFHEGVEIITNLGTGFGFRNRTIALPISVRGIS